MPVLLWKLARALHGYLSHLFRVMATNKHLAAAGDLRRFLEELQDENDLLVVKEEVDPDMELAAITRRVYEMEERHHCSKRSRVATGTVCFVSLEPRSGSVESPASGLDVSQSP